MRDTDGKKHSRAPRVGRVCANPDGSVIQPTTKSPRGLAARSIPDEPESAEAESEPPSCPGAGHARPPPGRLRRDLRSITGDGVLYSLMIGCGESHFAAFALALGMGQALAGLVASVPLAAGATLQLVAPWAVRRLGSHKRWVMACATVQGLSFVPMIVGGAAGTMPALALFAFASLYWAAALGCGPAWNTWVGTIIPARIRTRYFGGRTRVAQVGTSVGLLGSGLVLHAASKTDWLLSAFALMFLIAGCARLACLLFLRAQSEPVPLPREARIVPPRELLRRARHGADGRLLVYMACTTAAVHVATPFLNPFMLKQLRFDYTQYVVLLAAAFIARIIAPPFLSRFAQRFGVRRLLWVGGLGIAPLSALWTVSGEFWYLLGIQLLSGVLWAAYELSTFLLFFETIRQEERTSVLSAFNFANCAAILLGSMIGGGLLGLLGESHAAYMVVFCVSLAARVLGVGLLARLQPPRRQGRAFPPSLTTALPAASAAPCHPGAPESEPRARRTGSGGARRRAAR